MLLSDKRYSGKTLDLIKRCDKRIDTHFHRHLVSQNSDLAITYNDGLFHENDFVRDGVSLGMNSRKHLQRILLDVEVDAELKRAISRAAKYEMVLKAEKLLAEEMSRSMISKIKITSDLSSAMLKLPEGFPEFIDVLFDPELRYSNLIGIIENMPTVKNRLLNLVNNDKFCKRIGKRNVVTHDTKAAIGFLGIESVKIILPLLVVKSQLRFSCSHFSKIAKRLWFFHVLTANAYKELMHINGNHERGAEGFMCTMFTTLGRASIHNLFLQCFEDVKSKMLSTLRADNNYALYNAMIDAKPDPTLLTKSLYSLSPLATKKLMSQFSNKRVENIKLAVAENIMKVDCHSRSLAGIAFGQAESIAKRYMLEETDSFPENLSKGYDCCTYIKPETRRHMEDVDLTFIQVSRHAIKAIG